MYCCINVTKAGTDRLFQMCEAILNEDQFKYDSFNKKPSNIIYDNTGWVFTPSWDDDYNGWDGVCFCAKHALEGEVWIEDHEPDSG